MTDRKRVSGVVTRKNNVILSYTVLFAIISLISFSFFLVFRKSLIYEADGVLQHYTNLVKLRHMIGDLLRGNGLSLWSDEVAMGGDTIGNLSMVTLCDPFAYIAAAFPVRFIDIGYSIATVLRLYCAGLAMIGFTKYRGFRSGKCVLAAISYAFCYWGMGVIRHGIFLMPMILFPLILWGIEKVWKKERPWLLIFSVSFSLLSSLYFSYMTGIIGFLYLMVRFFSEEEHKSFWGFLKRIVPFIGYVLISCCLAAPILIGVVYTLLSCSTSSGIDIHILPTWKEFLLYIPSLTTKTEVIRYFSFTGVNALFTLFVPFAVFGIKEKGKRVPCLMFLFCLLMMVFPFWGSLMNAFSYATGRWGYALAFFFVWMGLEQWEQYQNMTEKMKKICLCWMGLLVGSTLISGMIFGVISSEDMAFSFFEIGFMVFFFLKNKMKMQTILAVLVINIGVGYCIQFSPFGNDNMNAISQYAGIGETYERYEDSVLRGTTAIKDSDFYRVDYAEHIATSDDKYILSCMPANESVYWDARTICGYYSTIENRVFEYNRQVCNSQNYCRRTSVFSNDNRSRLNFLQGVKYYLQEEENRNELIDTSKYAGYGFTKYKTKKGVTIKQSKYDAGLGYVMPKIVYEREYQEQSPLKSEQILMQAAVVEGLDVESTGKKALVAAPDTLQYEDHLVSYELDDKTSVDWKGKTSFDVSTDKNMIFLSIPEMENVELYVEFQNLKRVPFSWEEQRQIREEKEGKELSVYENRLNKLSDILNGEKTDEFGYYACFGNVKKLVNYISNLPQGITDQSDFLTNIGFFKKTDNVINLTFSGQGHYTFDRLNVYAVKQDNFDRQAAQLSDNRFTATKVTDDKIEGTVNSSYDGWLYLNLIYNPGWNVYVDGVQTALFRTDTCFSGLPLDRGHHEIVLEYSPYGMKYGWMAFAAGVFGCILIVLVLLFRRKRKGESNE